MRRAKYLLAAILAIGLIAVAFQAYSTYSANSAQPTTAFAPGPGGINYPNPISPNVTVSGVITSSTISPACSLSSPPCAISDSPLYYITANGWNYRLIFPNSTKIPLNHSHIFVTGVYVTPSTYQASQWTPHMYFRGDIYVTNYYYISPIL
jgi:hypothetical protein